MEPTDLLVELARAQSELLGLYSQLASAKTRFAKRLDEIQEDLEVLLPVEIAPTYNGFGELPFVLQNHDLQKEAHNLAYQCSLLVRHLARPSGNPDEVSPEVTPDT